MQAKTQQKTWTAAQLRKLLDYARPDHLSAAWTLAAMTGMRRGEVLGLLWSDVDLDTARLSVTRTLVSIAYQLQISEPKTSKRPRTVALAVAAAESVTPSGAPATPELTGLREVGRVAAGQDEHHAEEALRLVHQLVAEAYPLPD